jgi:hypothetical protein
MGNFLPIKRWRRTEEQVAGAACCDSGNTTCAAGLSCITGY